MDQGKPDNGKMPPRWDLRDLYASPQSPEIGRDLERLRAASAAFAARYQGQVSMLDGAELATAISAYEDISRIAARLESFSALTRAADRNESDFAQNLTAQVRKAVKPSGFFTAEINAMKETDLFEKMAAPELAALGYWLGRVRAFREHQLDTAVEHYLEDKSAVAETAWKRLYGMTLAAMRFEIRGETLTEPEVRRLMNDDADPTLRQEAFDAFAKGLADRKETFALVFNTLAKLKEADDARRGFEKPEDSRHLTNRINPVAIEAMMEAVRASAADTAHRYYEWKARKTGVARLHPADRNAPLPVSGGESRLTWDEARDVVLEAFAAFSPEFARIAKRFFDEGWIDAEPRAGKSGGAFSMPTVQDAHPYIFMNFTGTPHDVQVLAYELGHGVHQMLAAERGFFGMEAPVTMAETASVFSEAIVFRHLLERELDPAARRDMLASRIEDVLDAVVRQAAFFSFEQKFHAERREKGELSAARISALWLETQRESLGPFVNMDIAGAENLWMGVPHFVHAPFYVYAYVFGDGVARALSVEREKTALPGDFAGKYLELLREGGTKNQEAALKPFGLDLQATDFWKRSFAAIGRDIDALIALDREIGDTPDRKAAFNASAAVNDNMPEAQKQAKKRRGAKPSGPKGGR